jgi:hypothetical protein
MALAALTAIFAVACSGDDDDDDGGDEAGFTDAGYKAAGLDKARIITVDGDIPIGISSALTGEVAGLGIPIADSAEVASEGITSRARRSSGFAKTTFAALKADRPPLTGS